MISNRYNQAPHLTQETNGKVTTSQLDKDVLKMSSAFYVRCIFSSALQTRLNTINLDQTVSLGSSLICVHIVFNIGYLRTQADEIADNKCRDWRAKGLNLESHTRCLLIFLARGLHLLEAILC